MLTDTQLQDAKIARDAAQIAYTDLPEDTILNDPRHPHLQGYRVDEDFGTAINEGLNVYALTNSEGDIVIAFRGSWERQDWWDDVANLGYEQWRAAVDKVLPYLEEKLTDGPAGRQVIITGHSLGGALAQYAAYAYAQTDGAKKDNVSLYTFSGLSGVYGIEASSGEYRKSVAPVSRRSRRLVADGRKRCGGGWGGQPMAPEPQPGVCA
jgi:pimeloyl-ACP methyl ester carboxylesterase